MSTTLLTLPVLILLGTGFAYPLYFVVRTSFENGLSDYAWAVQDPINQSVFLRTFVLAALATAICCMLAFPYAYLMTVVKPAWALGMAAVVLVPFWTSTLIRVFAWTIILQPRGVLNWLLGIVGLGPVTLLGTTAAVLIGMCQVMLPFAVLPMYAVMNRIDATVVVAAQSLGAPRARAFRDAYVPQTIPGVSAGAGLVFITSLGFYITPALLGSPRDSMVSVLITTQVQSLGNWQRAAALGVLLLLLTLAVLGVAAAIARRLGIGRTS
jgi:putative spermidine/putrescine transport system permease protein